MIHRPNLPLSALLIPVCCILPLFACAQSIGPNVLGVAAKGIYMPDGSILLRWSPANIKTWEWCRDSGYTLVRITLADQNGSLSSEDQSASIVQLVMLPKTQSQWEAAMLTDSAAVGVAAGAYYGEDFDVAGPAPEGIVTAHNTVSEKENRFGLSLFAADISWLAAEMQNLVHKDAAVQAGYKYAYIIRPGGHTGAKQLKPGRVSITAADPYAPPSPAEFSGQAGDSVATLVWNQALTAEHYACYDVYRAKNNGLFQRVNAEPVLPTEPQEGKETKQLLFYARLENNTDSFRFKVCGHSPFGFDGPFSQVVTVKGVPAPLSAVIRVAEIEEMSSGMNIHWAFPDSMNHRILGFNLLRSPVHEGPYTALNTSLINKTQRQYTDPAPLPVNYYKLAFVDDHDNTVASNPKLAQPKDSIAPEPPSSVAGEAVGEKGLLRIHWSPSPSADVMGYRVFMADQPDGSYGQVTAKWTKDTIFYQTVNASSLTEQKYFKIKAIDRRENTSGFSPVCTVQLPDIVPPSRPVLKKTAPQAGGVLVEFAPSQSKDVRAHRILRKKKDDAEWQELVKLDSLAGKASVSYLDTTAEKMYSYAYMVQAVDDAGEKSNSKAFPVKRTGNGLRAPVQQFEAKFVKSAEEVRLNWTYNNAYRIMGFVIYRGTPSGQMTETGFVTPGQVLDGGKYDGPDPFKPGQGATSVGNTGTPTPGGHLPAGSFNLQQTGSANTTHTISCSYADKQFLTFKTYLYAVAVRFEDGTCSPMSSPKSVTPY